MKIRYLAAFLTISLLSMGAVTTVTSNTFANPCASKVNPCASTKKTNPCAGKKKASSGSVGGKLAQELQGKPVVVDIYASWCPACKNIAPTVSELKQQYGDKISYIVLDVSNKSSSAKAEATAKKLGLSKFFTANRSQTGSIAIVDPATGKILAQHRNNPDKTAYTSVLDAALASK